MLEGCCLLVVWLQVEWMLQKIADPGGWAPLERDRHHRQCHAWQEGYVICCGEAYLLALGSGRVMENVHRHLVQDDASWVCVALGQKTRARSDRSSCRTRLRGAWRCWRHT